jgi:hypothetical protein
VTAAEERERQARELLADAAYFAGYCLGEPNAGERADKWLNRMRSFLAASPTPDEEH